jgi:hypothetical protein
LAGIPPNVSIILVSKHKESMSKKDLFKIILKLYGLYYFIELFIQIQSLSYYTYTDWEGALSLIFLLLPILSAFVIYILLFKSEMIIKLFKLDQGFDNNDSGNNLLNGQAVTKIALIIIAIFLIVNNLANFVSQVLYSFKASVSTNYVNDILGEFHPDPLNYNLMISSGINLIIGLLLLTNSLRLSNWIEKLNNKNVS